MMWHVVFAERGGLPQSRAARSRDSAFGWHASSQSVLRRSTSIEPNGSFIERAELDEHFDGGRFPGLRRDASSIRFVNKSASKIEPECLPVAQHNRRAARQCGLPRA